MIKVSFEELTEWVNNAEVGSELVYAVGTFNSHTRVVVDEDGTEHTVKPLTMKAVVKFAEDGLVFAYQKPTQFLDSETLERVYEYRVRRLNLGPSARPYNDYVMDVVKEQRGSSSKVEKHYSPEQRRLMMKGR